MASVSEFGLIELTNASGLKAQLLPSGALFALRHQTTLINQFLPGPPENGLFRLLLRWRDTDPDAAFSWAPLVGPGLTFKPLTPSGAAWSCSPAPGLHAQAQLELHPELSAWRWRIAIRNESLVPIVVDVLHAQDLGLADEAAVRNNEAYTSQYIDLLPLRDERLGWSVLARQNQAMSGGRRPWLGVACTTGAAEFCTDGWQFFGGDHRLTGVAAAVTQPNLPSHRLQYEFALAGLQTRPLELPPGGNGEFGFIACYQPDHPHASSINDLTLVHDAIDREWSRGTVSLSAFRTEPPVPNQPTTASSLFTRADWLHGDVPSVGDWDAWFHGERRHEEYNSDDSLVSFFCDAHTHVVSREKEATIARPHGHILRSGNSRWFDLDHFGLTCYAAGVFGAQAYLGHPSFARLLSVMRNALSVARASGQRVFVRREDKWHQLGIPSAFVMTPEEVRWIYRMGDDVIEARAWCAASQPASFLELRVTAGAPCEFLVTHEIVLGAAEFESRGRIEFHHEAGWVSGQPAASTLVGQHQPGVCFAIAAADPASVAAIGGEVLLYDDTADRTGPYVVIHTQPVTSCAVILLGSSNGVASLSDAVTAARNSYLMAEAPASPPATPMRVTGGSDAGVLRVNDVLPWFAHNASIHFSAPHGLEQYGGAAWGVRDVCQGSVEWLLAAGEFGIVRRILETVFAQQYPHDGSWPQWFMFAPYRFIQQAHSHGDVCFWPVKALCDYIEASNDTSFLQTKLGYTDATKFSESGPHETILQHCDRVIAQCEARFVAGTALVNYGDGDWDDTLQPADPTLRTRMISAWTVGLAFHAFRQLAEVCRRAGEVARADRLNSLCARMREDFAARLMPRGIVAGFLVTEPDGHSRPLLHPDDEVTHIRYRLLPMTRSILAELFTVDEAERHMTIVEQELRFPDGVRLMSEPSTYQGGLERLFKRAETAANVGREIGLQYVHAHLRYAEALAKLGDADALWTALQVVNPIDLVASVPSAAPRQSNVYFSSSDADFADRYVAAAHWSELRSGRIPVRGGWRLYSSGPGLFLHKVRACLLGVREYFSDVVFDPVLPLALNELVAHVTLCGRSVELRYKVETSRFSPTKLTVNGQSLPLNRREANPYRAGGVLVSRAELGTFLQSGDNVIHIEL